MHLVLNAKALLFLTTLAEMAALKMNFLLSHRLFSLYFLSFTAIAYKTYGAINQMQDFFCSAAPSMIRITT